MKRATVKSGETWGKVAEGRGIIVQQASDIYAVREERKGQDNE